MSYDIYFTKPIISRDQFFGYFKNRKHYEVSDSQVCYRNEDTGVYFLIDHNEVGESSEEEVPSTAILRLNLFRPHNFGLEAAGEISAFINHFGFSIHDPQNGQLADGAFVKEEFLKRWNHSNEFGYSSLLNGANPPQNIFSLPGDRIESIWRWNFEKEFVQGQLTEDIFVPRIFYITINGKVFSAVVWPDAISELIPEVDYLLIGRDKLAPKSFFGSKKKDQIWIPLSEVLDLIKAYSVDGYALPSYKLPAPIAPKFICEKIIHLKPTSISPAGISHDLVLNQEIVLKVRG